MSALSNFCIYPLMGPIKSMLPWAQSWRGYELGLGLLILIEKGTYLLIGEKTVPFLIISISWHAFCERNCSTQKFSEHNMLCKMFESLLTKHYILCYLFRCGKLFHNLRFMDGEIQPFRLLLTMLNYFNVSTYWYSWSWWPESVSASSMGQTFQVKVFLLL